ncbi:hypothetical protein HG536_0E03700 [Torulaspora globosa]|uniref:Myosin motor domain-containing protein n=1 Tax=Torulaspora globosa TaxID=48254 RepID=A0A7G3ZIX3_9SACH|nr:uncharacterized protein HG536_0E03700 [Torulaspora globosa]QLL33459.1 hypothetical protein HG536_0E03700 [Torulaspora globosa]
MANRDQETVVWVPDEAKIFIRGTLLRTKIVKDKGNRDKQVGVVRLLETNEEKEYAILDVSPVNPPTFDKVDDMSELTHLNEASVLYNLENRYREDMIYTYSGLFLVAINPYCNLKLYSQEYINLYHGSPREDNKPHIFAIAEEAYQRLLSDKRDQSILVTGESGAGKTENTKKILQYLASITSEDKLISSGSESFELKILQSNPILESFGNSQTVRNNNSSRFGKFIKIEFDERGKINGAHIEWYLLEKSRIVHQNPLERNYHIFYQLLSGLSSQELRKLELDSRSITEYRYLRNSNASIPGVDDSQNLQELLTAFKIVGFDNDEVFEIFKIISIILHIGNVEFVSEKTEQASIKNDLTRLCKLLGVSEADLKAAILKPKSKAGKEWVSQSKNAAQARFILNSLSRSLYEKLFASIVARINRSLDHGSMTANFIGLLDIAGFEIFNFNSFEQLCINYTNERLQQFFNHYMFVLEQNEYLKENIQWDYIDYGKDLQSTINLIEQRGPVTGILPLLDEESILPKSTDETFFSKLMSTWDQNSSKFKRSKNPACFVLTHYAGDVEYNIDGWLSKNKDPISDNLLNVLKASSNQLVKAFFDDAQNKRGGSFRTSSARHREQLNSLLDQLSSTQPHFARCIIPNNKKKSKDFDRRLILEQLRCNGVLEGIRIAREGYPNRIFFKEFFQRYKLLSNDFAISNNSKKNCEFLLSSLHLDPSIYKVGSTKLFFKAGVLAELETKKEKIIDQILVKLTSQVRAYQVRNGTERKLKQLTAARVLGNSFRIYNKLLENPWYNLYLKIKPLLSSCQDIAKTKRIAEQVKTLEAKVQEIEGERDYFKNQNVSKSKELEELHVLLTTEKKNLEAQLRQLTEAKDRYISLQGKLEEADEQIKKYEEEKAEMQKLHEIAISEVSRIKRMSDEDEAKLNQLQEDKRSLQTRVKELERTIAEKEQIITALSEAKQKLDRDVDQLKNVESAKQDEINNLKQKLNNSEQNLDSKLATLEKNCNAAMGRLQALVSENNDLRQRLNVLEKEKQGASRDLKARESDLHRLESKVKSLQEELNTISSRRDYTVAEHAKVVSELKSTRAHASSLKITIQELEKKCEQLQKQSTDVKVQGEKNGNENTAIKDLKRRLAEEISLNRYLNQKISTHVTDGRISKETENGPILSHDSQNENLIRNEDLRIHLKQLNRKLDEAIEEKKDLLSRLRFTETRLASSSFDSQIAHSQVKTLKKIIWDAKLPVNLEAELGQLKPSEINTEKLLLEVDHLKRQLELETKSRYDAENVAAALHSKFTQIQRSESSHDIYRLKYEASEERAKSLENRLRSFPLRDKTNTSGDIFINRESVSKYADEVRFHKLENYKLQEILADTEKKLAALNREAKQSSAKESLLSEQIERLQKDLEATERQNELMTVTVKQQKHQYESCLNDLHINEARSREYLHNLQEAEADVQNMAEVIEKLKIQIKQKDRQLWESDTERSNLDIQLQETLLELKKVQEINKVLNEDLRHLKERLAQEEDNSRYFDEIDNLKQQINLYMKSETDLKKEVAALKYDLQTASNDCEAKISDLLSQINHYEKLVGKLSDAKNAADATEDGLSKELNAAKEHVRTITTNLDVLSAQKSHLEQEIERLKQQYQSTSEALEKVSGEKSDLADRVKYLEETSRLYGEQDKRNESLVKQLHSDVDTLKKYLKEEKQKNIDLYEENQSEVKKNSLLSSKIDDLTAQLADSSEKEAWLSRIHELETLVSSESELKYEEKKKTRNLERIIEELNRKSSSDAQNLEAAKEGKKKTEEQLLQYVEQISMMERRIAQQELTLRKTVRDNTNLQEKIEDQEKESLYWRQKYESLAGAK